MALGASVAGVARIILEVDSRRANAEIKKTETNLTGFASRGTRGLKGLASAYTGLAAGAGLATVGLLIRKATDAASDLNEEQNKSKVIFGESRKAMLEWAQGAATSMGLSERAFLQGAGAVGNMLKTVGVTGPALADMSKEIVAAASDLASFNNEDPSEMLDRLRSGLAGEAEPLRRFGILLSEARVQQQAVSMGLVEQGDKLTEQQKVLARHALIMHDAATAHGDFGRTAQDNANQQRILTAEIENLESKLGRVLLPIQLKVTRQLVEWTSALNENKGLQEDIQGAIDGTTDAISTAVEVVQEIVELMGGWETASKFLVGGLLLRQVGKLTTAFTGLAGSQAAAGAASAGAAGVGIGGAAGATAALRANLLKLVARAYVVSIAVVIVDQATGGKISDMNKWFYDHVVRPGTKILTLGQFDPGPQGGYPGQAGPGAQPPGGGFLPGGRTATGAIQIARTSRDTHGKSLLPAFGPNIGDPRSATSAIDYMAKVGTPVLAPEDGNITRRGGTPGSGTPGGPGGLNLYFVGDSATAYFVTHLGWTAPVGRYRRGAVIAKVGPHVSGAHAHVEQSRTPLALRYAGASSRGPIQTPAPSAAAAAAAAAARPKPPEAPDLDEQLAKAQLTKSTKDDLRILRLIETSLEKQIATAKTTKKRAQLYRELKSTQDEIAQILEGPKTRKPRKRRSDADVAELTLPLRTLLEEAEATDKNLTDDLAALDRIIAFLQGKLAKAKKGTEAYLKILTSLNQFRSQRRGVEASAVAGAGGDARDPGVAALIEGGGRGTATRLFAPGRDITSEITTEEGLKQMGAVLADLAPERARLKAWGTQLWNMREAQRGMLRDLKSSLQKALNVKPAKLRDPVAIQKLRNKIAAKEADIAALTEAIDGVFGAWADLDNQETDRLIEIAGGEAERKSEPPPSSAGGIGEGGGFSESGTASMSQAEVDRNVIGFLGGMRDIPRSFGSNILANAFAPELGPGSRLPIGGSTITVTNIFPTPPPDPLAWSKGIEFELRTLV